MRKLPLFVLLGWSALIIKYPLIYSLSSFSGIFESKNLSDKQMISMLFTLINACTLRFQCQKFSLKDFTGHLTWFKCQLIAIIAIDAN